GYANQGFRVRLLRAPLDAARWQDAAGRVELQQLVVLHRRRNWKGPRQTPRPPSACRSQLGGNGGRQDRLPRLNVEPEGWQGGPRGRRCAEPEGAAIHDLL